jgi:DNA-binding response OmpR family regulator
LAHYLHCNKLKEQNITQIEIKEGVMNSGTKVLVVDDEKRICHNVKKILSKNNFEVTEAINAADALEKMAKESFSLLISDIVMPDMNGLELLKLVKNQWPLTKAVMMTAYASTDTAVKAIRLGALDYIPKPFTPEELRTTVDRAFSDDIVEFKTPPAEKEAINIIDVDIPFDQDEVAKYTGKEYAKNIGPSDMPVIEVKMPEPLENFCEMGNMVCDIFKKLGTTCKVGTKKGLCPQKKKKKGKTAKGPDVRTLIGIDMPFDYNEVAAVTGPEYIQNLQSEGVSIRPYEELKREFAKQMKIKTEQPEMTHELTKEPAHRNILVIDDEVSVNNNIRKILIKKGYHVDQAVTKSEALEKIHSASYHLILLDLRIPGVKGLELLKAVHDHRPEAKVIIITGYASIETAVETARMGAVDYLNKPFTPNEIRQATDNALRFAA